MLETVTVDSYGLVILRIQLDVILISVVIVSLPNKKNVKGSEIHQDQRSLGLRGGIWKFLKHQNNVNFNQVVWQLGNELMIPPFIDMEPPIIYYKQGWRPPMLSWTRLRQCLHQWSLHNLPIRNVTQNCLGQHHCSVGDYAALNPVL